MTPVPAGEGEEGFTLVELLVGIFVGAIVLFATLQTFDGFSRNTTHQTRVTDANEQVRRLMDRTVRDLRGAATIVNAGSTDLIYTVPEPAGLRTERICVAGGRLHSHTSVAPAVAPTGASPCTGQPLATMKSTERTTFTYDGATATATPASVRNVGLTFSLDSSFSSKRSDSTLRASATRRSGALLVTGDDVDTTCLSDGALLNLDVELPGAGPITVNYATDGGIAIGTPVTGGIKIPQGITSVLATVTDAAGVTQTVRREVECS